VLIALHRRELAFRALALRSLLARALAALIAIALAMWGAGLWSIVAQQVLMAVLSAAALWWLSAVARPRLGWDGRALREMLALGIPSTLQQFVAIANARLFILLAALQLSVAAVGLMALAFRAVDMVRDLLAQAISQLALPLFARIEREGGDRRTAFIAAVRLSSALLLPLFAGLALLSPEVVQLAFGPQWLEAAPFVSMLALLTFHYFPRQFVTPLFGALGRPAAPLFGSLAQALFIVSMMWALPQASPLWVLGIWAARLLLSTPIDMWFLKRLSGIGYIDQWRGAFVPALACAVLAAGVGGLRLFGLDDVAAVWRLLLLATAGAASYVLALWVFDRSLLHELKAAFTLGLRRRQSPLAA
jgi:PST family polysaccharide transporter